MQLKKKEEDGMLGDMTDVAKAGYAGYQAGGVSEGAMRVRSISQRFTTYSILHPSN